ncbi:MAG: tetratricopeptide repeat protein [Bacteroidota bacterium]
MNKSFLIIILVSLGLVATLYSLPKIIVGEKKELLTGTANRDKPLKKEEMGENEPDKEESHANKLDANQQKLINQLKVNYFETTPDKKEELGKKLINEFAKFQMFDSAAYYSEKLSVSNPNEKNWIATGDYYYQAFTYALEDVKSVKMGEKSREYYQKALDKNPNLLLAKTNMAMTYVSTQTPMQGILLLREVVAESPDYEPALFNLGLLSMRSNQFLKAVERFRHITKNNPNNTKAAFYLGVSLARLGRNEEAKEVLLKVKEIDKDPSIQAELSTLLNELN